MPKQAQTSTVEESPIQYKKNMDGKEVITAIKGYMLQAGNNVKGVLVEHGLGNLLSTSSLAGNKFDEEFKKSINAAKTQLNVGQTRIVVPVHLGDHFATVAIDTAKNTAVIIEPTNSYKTQIDNLEKLLKEIFSSPVINVQQCPTKIQDDNFSCGPIASKIGAHLLTCNEDLVTAIDENHLPKIVYPLDTEEKRKALVADVQKAYKTKIDSVKKDLEYDCAIQATVLGIFNLIATGQLDDAKYVETQKKLLKLYNAYLCKEAGGKSVHPNNVTWDKFKVYLLQNDTEAKQKQLAQTFAELWSGEFITILENPQILNRFQNDMLILLEQEFNDFLANKASDSEDKNYERFTYIKNIFVQLKNDAALGDGTAKTKALKEWWKREGRGRLFTEYNGTDDGKKFPNLFDLQVHAAYLAGFDFDFGTDAANLKNIYTPGYGDVELNRLNVILGASAKQIIQELCNEKDGIFNKIIGPHESYRFKKLTDVERKNKLQTIIVKYFKDIHEQEGVVAGILKLVNLKQSHPLLSLTKQGDQWGIIDTVPNNPWLKVKSFKAEVPTNDNVTTPKIDFTKAEVKQKIKDVCEHFKTKNAGKKYEVVGDDQVNVNGHAVKVISNGFEYKKVTKEIIEFVVKALAEIFSQQGITDPAQRIVKLTLAPENEKYRKDYLEELKKCHLTLDEDAVNTLHRSQSGDPQYQRHGLFGQQTGNQTPADQSQKAATSTAPVTPPSGAQSAPLTGSATGTASHTQLEAEQHRKNNPPIRSC